MLFRSIRFISKQPIEILRKYTAASDIGVTLDKPTNINYRFSLPNKLFDYIQAGIPILSSDLPEIKNVIRHYNIGCICPNHEPKAIASLIEQMLNDENQLDKWKKNLKVAANELNWEKEKETLLNLFKKIG